MLNGLGNAIWLFAEANADFERVDLGPGGTLWLGGAVGTYLVIILAISAFATRKVATTEDFVVAGRKLPLFLCWGSLIATWFGATAITGAAQNARDGGLSEVILDPIACGLTLLLAAFLLAGPLWRLKLMTTGDFFRRAYGPRAEILACIVQIPTYFGWIAAQYLALGEIQQAYFGVELNVGVALACLLILICTMVGGMWSVTLTDTLQILIAFAGLLALGYATCSQVGVQFGDGTAYSGLLAIYRENHRVDPHLVSFWPSVAGVAGWLAWGGVWATGLFGNLPGQDLQQRLYSARSADVAKATCIAAGITYLIFGMIPVTLGLASRLTDPNYAGVGILPRLAGQHLSQPMAIVFVIAYVSILVSAATGAVLAPSSILGHNLFGRLRVFQGHGLRLERMCVVLMSLSGLLMAYTGESIMGLLDFSLSLSLVATFLPLMMGLYGRPRSEWSALWAMGLGMTFYFHRYLPEQLLAMSLRHSATPEISWLDSLQQTFPRLNTAIRCWAVIPADVYGFVAAVVGYSISQWRHAGQPPTNAELLQSAWPHRNTSSTIPPVAG